MPPPRRLQLAVSFSLVLLSGGCVNDRGPVLAGTYSTWDDVIARWIGQQKVDLYDELGPPQFHNEAQDGMESGFH